MGKIRKKTSKRGTTHQRKRIQNKVKESRKKAKKESKKNPQWKSKKSKDPGIPNSFPYKDQLLAEIAEERRKVVELKERRKEEKKALRAQGNGHADDEDEKNGENSEPDADGPPDGRAFDGIETLHKTVAQKKLSYKATDRPARAEEVPLLFNPDWSHMQAVLDDVEAIIEVLDARDPLASRLRYIENLAAVAGKKIMFVLNKIDTCPRENIAAWAAHLRKEYPTVLFRSASAFISAPHDSTAQSTRSRVSTTDAWGINTVLDILGEWDQENDNALMKVAVVGWSNAGKSSFINSLLGRDTLPIYALSCALQGTVTTSHPVGQPLVFGTHAITIIDTPGISPVTSVSFSARTAESESLRAADALLRARGRLDRLHDPLPALSHIVARFEAPEDIMLFYNLPAFAHGEPGALLAALARSQGLIKKKGVLDKVSAARVLLRDWVTGKLPRVATPPAFADPAQQDEDILLRLRTLAEMRKGEAGLVRLAARPVEQRPIDLSALWTVPGVSKSRGDQSKGGDEDDTEDRDDGEDGEDEDEGTDGVGSGEDEGAEVVQISGKRKAPGQSLSPAKKVSFDLPVKNRTKPNAAKANRKAAPVPSKRLSNIPPKAKAKALPSSSTDHAYSFEAYFK